MAMGDEMGLFILLPMRSLAEKFVKRFAVRNADVAKKTAGKGSARRWLPSAMLKAASLGGGLRGACGAWATWVSRKNAHAFGYHYALTTRL